ncbi:Ig-like domain-containing protein [Streptacidiphilus sp. N1-10]|uniref:Ig-like domain-containing protein n=1 Tax=Streptacidiphilus jeojiensis TaxID=3229225 RepID=A0ABV6Y0R5_9ACTN
MNVRRIASPARDRADAVSGVPTVIDLYTGSLPTERALVAPTSAPLHGRAVISDEGTATYTSVPGFTGSDSFGYRFTDERGRSSRVTVAVQVAPDAEPEDAEPGDGDTALAYAA